MSALSDCEAELTPAHAVLLESIEEDLTPQAALYFCWEMAKVALTIATAAAASLADPDDDNQPVLSEMINGVSEALAGYTVALMALDVLPPVAGEAMKSGVARA
jgi:hypothetical protein